MDKKLLKIKESATHLLHEGISPRALSKGRLYSQGLFTLDGASLLATWAAMSILAFSLCWLHTPVLWAFWLACLLLSLWQLVAVLYPRSLLFSIFYWTTIITSVLSMVSSVLSYAWICFVSNEELLENMPQETRDELEPFMPLLRPGTLLFGISSVFLNYFVIAAVVHTRRQAKLVLPQ